MTDKFLCKYEKHGICNKFLHECDSDRGLCKFFHHCHNCKHNCEPPITKVTDNDFI